MKKFILAISFIALAVIAGQLSYTSTEVEDAVAIVVGDTTDATLYTALVTFTNGATIQCNGNVLEFVAGP